MNLRKVIAGAQVGADIAGLRAAKRAGLETGGWMPRDWRTLAGARPEYAELYGMQECQTGGYAKRTQLNVQQSDGTVRLAYNMRSPGEKLTLQFIELYAKPYFDVMIKRTPLGDWPFTVIGPHWTDLAAWLIEHRIGVLNVAGNGDPAIEQPVESYLFQAFGG